MTGKRHDQYDVDPGSPANSDNRDGAHDPNLMAADKGRVARTEVEERESLIPRRGTNPALAEVQAKRAAARAAQVPAGGGDAPRIEVRDDAERAE